MYLPQDVWKPRSRCMAARRTCLGCVETSCGQEMYLLYYKHQKPFHTWDCSYRWQISKDYFLERREICKTLSYPWLWVSMVFFGGFWDLSRNFNWLRIAFFLATEVNSQPIGIFWYISISKHQSVQGVVRRKVAQRQLMNRHHKSPVMSLINRFDPHLYSCKSFHSLM